MEIVIQPDTAAATELVARLIARALADKPRLVMGLATGSTMEALYARLVDMHRDAGLDFSGAATFNLDEYVGLPEGSPDSYLAYMRRHLFERVNLRPANTHLPDGAAADLEAECLRYEQAIREAGGIDLQILGIGSNGHIGFNEPLSALLSRTRVQTLTPATVEQNARYFADPQAMPRRAVTMGIGTILESRRCIMLATGRSKAGVVAAAVEGPLTAMLPASALQAHPQCTIVLDQDAAARLRNGDYYRLIFDHEPQWAPYRESRP